MATFFLDAEESAAQTISVRQACFLAVFALLLYETCLTADLELRHIWARGRARMLFLFVSIRHVQLANVIVTAISFAYASPETCQLFTYIDGVLLVIPYFGWAVFLAWRAYALSSGNTFIGLLVFICGASFASPSLLEYVGSTSIYVENEPVPCVAIWRWADGLKVAAYLLYVSRIINLIGEVVVLVLTIRASYATWRSSRNIPHAPSLPDVLYSNGVLCFTVVAVLHVTTAILTLVPSTARAAPDTIAVFRDAVITVVLSRFIIQLGAVDTRSSDAEQGAKDTKGILTTEWTGEISDIPSQWSLDEEYNGRGFDRDIDTFALKECYEKRRAGVSFMIQQS